MIVKKAINEGYNNGQKDFEHSYFVKASELQAINAWSHAFGAGQALGEGCAKNRMYVGVNDKNAIDGILPQRSIEPMNYLRPNLKPASRGSGLLR